ncbi:hypothetical protein BO99DRAFT_184328 [Aspergillus violaceofuscus CBS 115571]|uniref:Uncharacterized protein n=1 Tax=Aspergillus violaceofuscus (strain CBS 115571) TaxID=1450538 RepID=A0A2V5IE01_ASPV1|nr:hypothetical protein BO99DRAFT_184328 [Aspergillus violaceofuscus CBS 115571]
MILGRIPDRFARQSLRPPKKSARRWMYMPYKGLDLRRPTASAVPASAGLTVIFQSSLNLAGLSICKYLFRVVLHSTYVM